MIGSRALLVLLTAMVTVTGAVDPAWAHRVPAAAPAPPEEASAAAGVETGELAPLPGQPAQGRPAADRSAPPGIPIALVLLVLAALATGAGRGRRRHEVAVALVAVLAVFAFEGAVHSVHHLSDSSPGESCAVASAVAQLAADHLDRPRPTPPTPTPVGRVAAASASKSSTAPVLPSPGRAPPSPRS